MKMKIIKHEQLNGWYPIPIPDVPVKVKFCPACNVPMPIIAVIGGKIRIGCCDYCGYMGYVDRPSAEWFEDFYRSKWDQRGQAPGFVPVQISRPQSPMDMQLSRMTSKKDKPLLDIGCGFGYTLSFAKSIGYNELYGVERSQHRAEAAEKYGFKIFRSGFEETDFGGKKFGTITHHHVLEHVEDPNTFIAKCASIQDTGDMMLLSVPNNLGEPTMGVLMFLPHLHSFTTTSIQRLLGRHNYEAIDFVTTNKEQLNVMAMKRSSPVSGIVSSGFSKTGIDKIVRGLDLKNRWLSTRKKLVWSLHHDDGKQLPLWKKPSGFQKPRSLIVKTDRNIGFPLHIDSPYIFVK